MKKILSLLAMVGFCTTIAAQDNLPTDYLTKEFHAGRREALRKSMPENSVTVIFAFPTRTFSNDVSYVYHPNPDLYYFSGYKEPHAVLLIFKDPQQVAGKSSKELFFIQKRNALAEQWTGRRLGVERVQKDLGFDTAFNGEKFADFPIDLTKFSKVIFSELPADVADETNDKADLYDLLTAFKSKAGIPADYDNNANTLIAQFGSFATAKNLAQMKNFVSQRVTGNPVLQNNALLKEIMAIKDSTELPALKEKIEGQKFNSSLYTKLVASLREIKTDEEMELLRKSVSISSLAHTEVMKAIHPNMSEREIQGLQEYIHKKYGAENVGYPSIVGGGPNGCVLHYEENAKLKIGNDMVLMDVGAEYHGYSADVTRTIPANGKFTKDQEAIYNLVYEAQEAVFKIAKEGTPFSDLNKTAKAVLAEGLVKLGIIKDKNEVGKYYPHGCSHFLGLDVHDAGDYSGKLKENMVITVEPGIYIPENSPCDKKWWGIAVRIEDDLRITKEAPENLSFQAPRKARDIEKMIAEKSVLETYTLPPLNTKKGF